LHARRLQPTLLGWRAAGGEFGFQAVEDGDEAMHRR
jgi:hypothetical protein